MKKEEDLKTRTRRFALSVIQLYVLIPKTTEGQVLGKQVLRSGTSVGAHYRESVRAKSDADFIHKIEGALQELEETAYWLELLGDAAILPPNDIRPLYEEADQLTAILVVMVRNVKNKNNRP